MADAEINPGSGWGNDAADAAPEDDSNPSQTVSRDELKKVIAERDAYKKRLRRLQRDLPPVDADASRTGALAPASEGREAQLRKTLAEKERTISRLLVDNEIADAAARLGAYDPKAVVKLTREFFAVREGKVQLADDVEDTGLSRFDDQGDERRLPDVVAEYLAHNDYLLRPSGLKGAGSRTGTHAGPLDLRGMNQQRFSRLSRTEKEAIRNLAGVPGRTRVW